MVKYFVYRYMDGFKTRKCLIVDFDEASARAQFFKAHPRLRPYNLLSVGEASSRVFELST